MLGYFESRNAEKEWEKGRKSNASAIISLAWIVLSFIIELFILKTIGKKANRFRDSIGTRGCRTIQPKFVSTSLIRARISRELYVSKSESPLEEEDTSIIDVSPMRQISKDINLLQAVYNRIIYRDWTEQEGTATVIIPIPMENTFGLARATRLSSAAPMARGVVRRGRVCCRSGHHSMIIYRSASTSIFRRSRDASVVARRRRRSPTSSFHGGGRNLHSAIEYRRACQSWIMARGYYSRSDRGSGSRGCDHRAAPRRAGRNRSSGKAKNHSGKRESRRPRRYKDQGSMISVQ